MYMWKIDDMLPMDTEDSAMPVLEKSACQNSLHSPPGVIQSLIDGGLCDNTKLMLCLDWLSNRQQLILFDAKKKKKRETCWVTVNSDIFP